MTEPTYRQADYWVRQGYLRPDARGGTGNRREWPTREMRIARLMGRLVAAGLTPAAAADAARVYLTTGGPIELGVGLVLAIDAPERGET